MVALARKLAPAAATPICVDLDGTLVLTDLFVESLLKLVKQSPLNALLVPFWLLKGKAYLKKRVAELVPVEPATLPYCRPFLQYLQEQRIKGRPLVLVTAADEAHAHAVANHLDLFDDVLASDGRTNLSGRRKAAALCQAFGARGFAYAGNDRVDRHVWACSGEAILVNPAPGVERAARDVSFTRVFAREGSRLGGWIRALRPHQWSKNVLVLVPLVTSHQVFDANLVGHALLAFVAFCLCASSAYVLNDLLDLSSDRLHPTKKARPFASGHIPVLHGLVLVPVLLALAFALSASQPPAFAALLALYYVVTLAYSLRLKQVILLDVLTLGGLYTLRIEAGAAAIGTESSFWLLAFSIFFFMSLALLKRYTELRGKLDSKLTRAHGRGYETLDIETLSQLGISSGFMAVVVLALYINSAQVTLLYSHPRLIWLICPLALYWIGRIWILGRRGEVNEDPVVFALRDGRSYVLGLVAAAILTAAI